MTPPLNKTSGNHAVADRRYAIGALRGHWSPPAGVHWFLDPALSDATLTTSHPVLGPRRYPLAIASGLLFGTEDAQFELTLNLAWPGKQKPLPVIFKSGSVSRPDLFRYLAKGDLYVGETAGIAVMRIHDLSWMTGTDETGLRILTMTTSLDRHFWEAADWISRPWLTRNNVEAFLHTEWRPDCPVPPAA